ncbi:hypothetical protein SAMN05880582_10191 [Rhizobium sp. RU20A]|uniref:hypothetical protein n=1 Tax=Rhizobium sp. RU20A TaxID=1907412 RepID=UPI000954B29F|nr:hypothetical protein [Rhizobium sp. RU20A]SIP93869.1 hypothetical protein SAMN05880582_10191 [Rhizobium sp. RU20A]
MTVPVIDTKTQFKRNFTSAGSDIGDLIHGIDLPLDRILVAPGIYVDLTGEADSTAAMYDYIKYCDSRAYDLVLPRGAIIGLAGTLKIPDGIGIVPRGCTLKALDGFNGGVPGGVLQLGSGDQNDRYHSATGLRGLKIDCNEQADAIGIDGQRVYATPIDGHIWKARNAGARFLAGYQVNGNLEIWGSCPHSRMGGTTRVAPGAVGFRSDCTDSWFHVNVQHYHNGIENRGGNNIFHKCHVWSSYYRDDNPAYFPFILGGSYTRYIACVADGMMTRDNRSEASPDNGGIAFFMPEERHAVSNSLNNCSVVIPDDGDILPEPNTLLLCYFTKDGFSVTEMQVQEKLKGCIPLGAGLKTDKGNTHAWRSFASIGGGDLRKYMRQPVYIPNSYLSHALTLEIGGSSEGIVQEASGSFQNMGAATAIRLSFILSSKGTASGPVSLSGLPSMARGRHTQYLSVTIRQARQPSPIFVGKVTGDLDTIRIEDQASGQPLMSDMLTDSSEIYVEGNLFVTEMDV